MPRQKKHASWPASSLLDGRVVEEVPHDELAQLVVALAGRGPDDGEHALDPGVEEALAQDTLPDHAGGAEENDFHVNTSSAGR